MPTHSSLTDFTQQKSTSPTNSGFPKSKKNHLSRTPTRHSHRCSARCASPVPAAHALAASDCRPQTFPPSVSGLQILILHWDGNPISIRNDEMWRYFWYILLFWGMNTKIEVYLQSLQGWAFVKISANDSFDGRNPAPHGIHKTL